MNSLQDRVVLNDGVKMPWLGLGVFNVGEGDEVYNSVRWALEAGYRHIDTASAYKNEAGVGKAVRDSGIPREQIFVTTKLWNRFQGYKTAIAACEESLRQLDMDYVDLYLIHWPGTDETRRLKSWDALLKLREQKKILSAGVSNFTVRDMEGVILSSGAAPSVNQIERNPLITQKECVDYAKSKGITVTAWAPILRGHIGEYPQIDIIARKYGKSGAQVILRWQLQSGVAAIPKSTNRDRIIENSQIFDFDLSIQDMANFDSMDQNKSSVDMIRLNKLDFD